MNTKNVEAFMIYDIVLYPDQRLMMPTEKVVDFDEALKKVVDDMFETHYAQKNCAGLAAPQLGIMKQITVIDFSENKDQPFCLINPEITSFSANTTEEAEGCMSIPGISAKVKRPASIVVRAQNVEGDTFEMNADGFMARCIQHEVDHLNGVLFINRLSPLKKSMINKKLKRFGAG